MAKPNTLTHIKDLTPDRRNARKHNPRNIGLIVDALQEVGAARSIVIDENGEVLAGNGTIEAAAEAGITKMQVVDADGDTIIAVRRSNLTPEQKTRLALFDNRSADLADWDADVLAELESEGDLLSGLFSADELLAELNQVPDFESDANGLRDEYSPNVGEVLYEPKETKHKPEELFKNEAAAALESEIALIQDKGIQKLLRARLAFFTAFNFSKIADYYAYQAKPEEKALFEKLALVLLDRDALIANGFAAIVEEVKEENGFNEDEDER